MQTTYRRNYRPLILAITLAFQAINADAYVYYDGNSTIPTYGAGTGALSYTFFNLSGSNCTLNAYGSGGNPAAYSAWAQANGWGNNGNAGFFNPTGLGGWVEDQNSTVEPYNPSPQVTNNYLFYNNYDPIDGATVPTGNISLDNGTPYNALITSGVLGPVSGNESINYPSMGDSWSIACQNGTPPIAVASLASAASVLQSNGPTYYPYPYSLQGWFENAAINPPAWAGCNSSTNPCGVGFTAPTNATGNLVLNWNVPSSAANYQAMGGLWSGINYNSTSDSYPASMALNQAMLPINLSAYVAANQGNFNPNNASQYMYYTMAYGGHYTLALGDPFIISSYAAKMLWFQVISQSLTLNDGTALSSISSTLSNTADTGVFESKSFEDNYVQWLLGSQASSQNYTGAPQLAASAYQSVFNAATVPITEETTWGQVWTAIADTAVNAVVVGAALIPGAGWGVLAVAGLGGALVTADGAATPDMNAAIANAHTATLSGPPPLSQAAPAVINPTEVASTTLLGLWLTNTFVQAQINGNGNGGPSPFLSNYSINTDNQACVSASAQFGYTQCNPLASSNDLLPNTASGLYAGPFGCTNLQLANNLLSGLCYPNNDWWSGQVNNGPNSNAPNGYYVNVYAQAQTSTQFSIWDAILTGSDVTTDSNGYIVMGGNVGNVPSFSPPVQMINATSGSAAPTAPLPAGLSVNTTFNLNTGTLTATGYTTTQTGDPTAAGPNPAPSATPSINVVISGANPADAIYTLSGGGVAPNYESSSGVLEIGYYSANGTVYTFANGAQSINMTGCAPNSTVTLTITPDATNASNAWGASGALACTVASTSLGSGMGVALDYNQCVKDHWATGGVVAAFTSAPNSATGEGGAVTLACACVPAYLDGAGHSRASSSQLLGGVIVGATSSNSQKCPPPSG